MLVAAWRKSDQLLPNTPASNYDRKKLFINRPLRPASNYYVLGISKFWWNKYCDLIFAAQNILWKILQQELYCWGGGFFKSHYIQGPAAPFVKIARLIEIRYKGFARKIDFRWNYAKNKLYVLACHAAAPGSKSANSNAIFFDLSIN